MFRDVLGMRLGLLTPALRYRRVRPAQQRESSSIKQFAWRAEGGEMRGEEQRESNRACRSQSASSRHSRDVDHEIAPRPRSSSHREREKERERGRCRFPRERQQPCVAVSPRDSRRNVGTIRQASKQPQTEESAGFEERRSIAPFRYARIGRGPGLEGISAGETMRREARSASVPLSLRSAQPIDPPRLSDSLIYIPSSTRNALHVACAYQHVDDDQPGLANARRPARNAVIIQRLRSPAREASRPGVINMQAGMWENCGAYPREHRGDR